MEPHEEQEEFPSDQKFPEGDCLSWGVVHLEVKHKKLTATDKYQYTWIPTSQSIRPYSEWQGHSIQLQVGQYSPVSSSK